MSSGEQFSLVWNSFPANLSSGLYTLLTDEHLVDVTLSAEGHILRAHKLILSVCSSYFRELFQGNTCKHPIVILKDVNYRDLSAMLHFMYQGEVNIKQEDISSFLKLAETLRIKGLTTERREDEVPECVSGRKEEEATRPPEGRVKSELIIGDDSLGAMSVEDATSLRPEEPLRTSGCSPPRTTMTTTTVEKMVKVTSGASQRAEIDFAAMRSINRILNESYDATAAMENEPLDYTSEVSRIPGSNDPGAPLNYRLSGSPRDRRPCQDWLPNFDAGGCGGDRGERGTGLGTENAHQPKDSRAEPQAEAASYSRGKRTVRGLPGGSLPLETTLRVVSEIGPTLRVDRGKVVRMYSCPWCLRHFTRKENLKLHVRYIHGPLESLTCKLCGNKYKNSNSLRVHSYLYHNTRRSKHAKSQLLTGDV